MAYEISKTLDYSTKDIQTPLGTASTQLYNDPDCTGHHLPGRPSFPSRLPEWSFEEADNAFVSAYRFYKDKECHEVGIHIEYLATPDLNGKNTYHCRPHAAYRRQHGTGAEGIRDQRHTGKSALMQRDSRPEGCGLPDGNIQRHGLHLMVRGHRPGTERPHVHRPDWAMLAIYFTAENFKRTKTQRYTEIAKLVFPIQENEKSIPGE